MTEHRAGDAGPGASSLATAAEVASVLGTAGLLVWLAFLTR